LRQLGLGLECADGLHMGLTCTGQPDCSLAQTAVSQTAFRKGAAHGTNVDAYLLWDQD
jgi:hypothetical protein